MDEMELFLREIRLRREELPEKSYLRALPVVRHIGKLTFHSPVTFFVGENGSGKSTLLEAVAIACGYNAEGGTQNFQFSTVQTHSELWKHLSVVRGIHRPRDGFFLRAESFYNVASNIDELARQPGTGRLIDSYGGVSLHEQSHGESFFALILHRFGGHGLYLLDEPEAALSPARQMALLVRLNELAEEGSQFVIATHSPILTAFPGADIYQLSEEGVLRTPYKQTDNYQLTKRFLLNPEGMLRELLEEE